MTSTDVLKLIKEKQVELADLRFTDARARFRMATHPVELELYYSC